MEQDFFLFVFDLFPSESVLIYFLHCFPYLILWRTVASFACSNVFVVIFNGINNGVDFYGKQIFIRRLCKLLLKKRAQTKPNTKNMDFMRANNLFTAVGWTVFSFFVVILFYVSHFCRIFASWFQQMPKCLSREEDTNNIYTLCEEARHEYVKKKSAMNANSLLLSTMS